MTEGMQLHDAQGRRKYLTDAERRAFLAAAGKAPRPVRTLCLVLAYTGCRITEALELTASRIDIEAQQIIFESLRKGSVSSRASKVSLPEPLPFVGCPLS